MLDRHARVLVTGATGMVGSALVRHLNALSFGDVLAPSRADVDLGDAGEVEGYFARHRPAYVFLVAARVGGIAANIAHPVGFLADNVTMAVNLLSACHRHATKKNLFLGSSCVYPRDAPQPMREACLMTGPLEPTNEGYALAKIVGLRLAHAYRTQYDMRTVCPMVSNIYGTNDHFDLDRSHVLSALVRRFVDAQTTNAPSVTLWGTGAARREFVHVDDVARAMLFLMDAYDSPEIINVGTGTDVSIAELAALVASEVGYTGAIHWDHSKPDGMPRKCLDTSRLRALGFEPAVDLRAGIRRTVAEYRALARGGARHD